MLASECRGLRSRAADFSDDEVIRRSVAAEIWSVVGRNISAVWSREDQTAADAKKRTRQAEALAALFLPLIHDAGRHRT